MDGFIIYAVCFGVGMLFTILSALLGHLFGGGDHGEVGTGGHAEAGFEHSGMPGMSMFSPTVMASFVTALGGFGMIFSRIDATRSIWVSLPLAAICGVGIAGGVFWLFNMMFSKTQSSSESRISTVVGMTATVITPIPQHGVGEIAYVQAGSRYTAPARTESGCAIANGATVRINRVVGAQFYVVPS